MVAAFAGATGAFGNQSLFDRLQSGEPSVAGENLQGRDQLVAAGRSATSTHILQVDRRRRRRTRDGRRRAGRRRGDRRASTVWPRSPRRSSCPRGSTAPRRRHCCRRRGDGFAAVVTFDPRPRGRARDRAQAAGRHAVRRPRRSAARCPRHDRRPRRPHRGDHLPGRDRPARRRGHRPAGQLPRHGARLRWLRRGRHADHRGHRLHRGRARLAARLLPRHRPRRHRRQRRHGPRARPVHRLRTAHGQPVPRGAAQPRAGSASRRDHPRRDPRLGRPHRGLGRPHRRLLRPDRRDLPRRTARVRGLHPQGHRIGRAVRRPRGDARGPHPGPRTLRRRCAPPAQAGHRAGPRGGRLLAPRDPRVPAPAAGDRRRARRPRDARRTRPRPPAHVLGQGAAAGQRAAAPVLHGAGAQLPAAVRAGRAGRRRGRPRGDAGVCRVAAGRRRAAPHRAGRERHRHPQPRGDRHSRRGAGRRGPRRRDSPAGRPSGLPHQGDRPGLRSAGLHRLAARTRARSRSPWSRSRPWCCSSS